MKEGRPTKFNPKFNLQAHKLALLGCTDVQIADFFNVHVDTIYEWKKRHRKFSEALKGGKILADTKVAVALYKRAIGYQYTEETFERIDTKGNLESISAEVIMQGAYRKKIVTKELPPDVGAITLWLKCRQRELWQDKNWWETLSYEQQQEVLKRMITLKEKENEKQLQST